MYLSEGNVFLKTGLFQIHFYSKCIKCGGWVENHKYGKEYKAVFKVRSIWSPKCYQLYCFDCISKYNLFKDYFRVEIQFLFRQRKTSGGEYHTAQLLQTLPIHLLIFYLKKSMAATTSGTVSLKLTSVVWHFPLWSQRKGIVLSLFFKAVWSSTTFN